MLSQHEVIYNATLSEFEKSDVKVLAAKALVQNLETRLQDLFSEKICLFRHWILVAMILPSLILKFAKRMMR